MIVTVMYPLFSFQSLNIVTLSFRLEYNRMRLENKCFGKKDTLFNSKPNLLKMCLSFIVFHRLRFNNLLFHLCF